MDPRFRWGSVGGPTGRAAEFCARTTPDGRIHCLAVFDFWYNGITIQGAFHAESLASGAWSASLVTDRPAWNMQDKDRGVRISSLAVSPTGQPHVVVRTVHELSPDEDHRLDYFGRTAAGTWQRELLTESRREFLEVLEDASPTVAALPDGTVAVAYAWVQTQKTGARRFSRLRLMLRPPAGPWSTRTILQGADAFASGDGADHTAWSPTLACDLSGRLHLLLTDVARTTWSCCGQQSWPGNLRYGWDDGTGWQFRTILRQASPPRLLGDDDTLFRSPAMALTPDGEKIAAMGVTSRVIRDQNGYATGTSATLAEVRLTQQHRIDAPVSTPLEPLLDRLLGSPVYDVNQDGVVDAGDLKGKR